MTKMILQVTKLTDSKIKSVSFYRFPEHIRCHEMCRRIVFPCDKAAVLEETISEKAGMAGTKTYLKEKLEDSRLNFYCRVAVIRLSYRRTERAEKKKVATKI